MSAPNLYELIDALEDPIEVQSSTDRRGMPSFSPKNDYRSKLTVVLRAMAEELSMLREDIGSM